MSTSSDEEPFRIDVNPVQTALFNDILSVSFNGSQEGDLPHLALQAQLTNLMRMAYYDWLPQFSAQAEASAISFHPSLAPWTRRGYWIVVICLLTQSIALACIVVLFCSQTRYSQLNDAWQAIAQVANSREVAEKLAMVSTGTSTEMKQALLIDGRDPKSRYKLSERIYAGGEKVVTALVPASEDPGMDIMRRRTAYQRVER